MGPCAGSREERSSVASGCAPWPGPVLSPLPPTPEIWVHREAGVLGNQAPQAPARTQPWGGEGL